MSGKFPLFFEGNITRSKFFHVFNIISTVNKTRNTSKCPFVELQNLRQTIPPLMSNVMLMHLAQNPLSGSFLFHLANALRQHKLYITRNQAVALALCACEVVIEELFVSLSFSSRQEDLLWRLISRTAHLPLPLNLQHFLVTKARQGEFNLAGVQVNTS